MNQIFNILKYYPESQRPIFFLFFFYFFTSNYLALFAKINLQY